MKAVETTMQTHLGQAVMSTAKCLRITTTAGVITGYTNHVRDLTIAGVTYLATGGISYTAVRSNEGLQVDNLDMTAFLTTAFEADIDAGVYDFAEILLFFVNYLDLTMGTVILRKGHWGTVTRQDGIMSVEMRGLADQLRTKTGFLFDTLCVATLGDLRCRVDMTTAGFRVTGTATAVDAGEPRRLFSDSTRTEATDFFAQGNVTFTSGNNSGITRDVRSFIGVEVSLYLPFPKDIVLTDAYSMDIGCDKRKATCKDVFANVDNFRGFPFIPTSADIHKLPGQAR